MSGSTIHLLAIGVGIAALVEFLLLRVGLRLGAVVPYEGVMETLTGIALFTGSAALNFAVLGGILLLFLLVAEGWRAPRGGLLPTGASWIRMTARVATVLAAGWYLVLAALPLAGFLVPLREVLGPYLVIFSAVATAIIVCYGWGRLPGASVPYRVLLLLTSFFLLSLHYGAAAQSFTISGDSLPGATVALGIAELLIVAVLLWSPFALRPGWNIKAGIAAFVVAGIIGGLLYANPWIARTMGIWTVAYTMYLPSLIYVAAAAAGIYTVAALILERIQGHQMRVMQAFGLSLLMLGGLKPDFSYLAILGVLGLLLLARSGSSGAVRN